MDQRRLEVGRGQLDGWGMGGLGGPRPPHKRGVGWGGGGDGEARNHHQGQLPLVATGDATGPTITAAN